MKYLLSIIILLVTLNVEGADKTWEGDIDSDWNNPNNWDGNALPANGDDIFINPTNYTTAPILSVASTFDPDDIFINNGAIFTINGTGTLTVADDIFVDASTFNIGGTSLDVDEIEAANSSNVNMTAGTITMAGDIDANSSSTFTISTTVTQTDNGEDFNIGSGASIVVLAGANVTGFEDMDFDGATGGSYTQTGGFVSIDENLKFEDSDDNTVNISGGTLDIGNDIKLITDNNHIVINGTADVNIADDVEFGDGGGTNGTNSSITIGGNATLDIVEDIELFGNGDGNGFNVEGNGTVNVTDIDDLTDVSVIEGGTINYSGGVLPVELLTFTGSAINGIVQLQWSTASELNNDLFEIQRADSSLTFVTIGTINGNGNSEELINYEFIDQLPLEGTNYYRLKQIDFDGEFEIFETIFVYVQPVVSTRKRLNIYPNPAVDGYLVISLGGTESSEFPALKIIDIEGHIILEKTLEWNQRRWRLDDLRSVIEPGTILFISTVVNSGIFNALSLNNYYLNSISLIQNSQNFYKYD